MSFGGKEAAWHTGFSSCSTILIFLNKKRVLFLCITFCTELGMGSGLVLFYFILFEPLKLN